MTTYTKDEVEFLMPAVWDSALIHNRDDNEPPAPDMPKAKHKDPRSVSNLWARGADIQRAYHNVGLSRREQQVLLLRYGFGELIMDVAEILGIAKSTVLRIIDGALETMLRYLNMGRSICDRIFGLRDEFPDEPDVLGAL